MKTFLKSIAALSCLFVATTTVNAQFYHYNGTCTQGAVKAQTSGLPSSNSLSSAVPACLVTVYITGTQNLATLYSNQGGGTPLGNPFTAPANALFSFYTSTGYYDVQNSGTGMQTTTLQNVGVGPVGGGGGGGGLNPGTQTQVVFYPTSGTTGGPTNVQVDAATGNFLTSPNTNGAFNTDRYANGAGNNGVSNLVNSTNCSAAGCLIARPQTSTDTELIATALNGSGAYTHATDSTYGVNAHYFYNAGWNLSSGNSNRDVQPTTCFWNDALAISNAREKCKPIYHINANAGIYVGSPWTLTMAANTNMWSYGRSIAQALGTTFVCYKVGDCALDYSYLYYRGGCIATSDECIEGDVKQLLEADPPHGTIITGGANATIIKSNFLNPGNQGDGYNLVSTSEVMSSGLITGQATGGGNLPNSITTSDTHAVSTGIATLNSTCGANVTRNAPVSATCAITITSGSFSAAAGATVCIADWRYPEQVNITDAGTGTVTLGLTYAHPPGTRIEQGGLCGGKLAMWGGLTPLVTPHYQFTTYFIAGSPTATTADYVLVYYGGQAGAVSIVVPTIGPYNIPGTITRASNVVTINTPSTTAYLLNKYVAPPQAAITVAGATPGDLNGTVTNTLNNPTSMTWTQTGANETGSGGTISVTGLNNYTIYCGAETVKVFTTLNGTGSPSPGFDGSLQVEPNNCSWPTGGGVAQPNHYSQAVVAHRTVLAGFTPPTGQGNQDHYSQYSGMGWSGAAENTVRDFDSLSSWVGQGGSIVPRIYLQSINDAYTTIFNFTYPPFNGGQVMSFGCPPEGCVSTAFPYKISQNTGINGGSFFNYNVGNSTYGMINAGLQNNLFMSATNAIGISNYGTLPGTAGLGGWFTPCTTSNDTLCLGNGIVGDSSGMLGAKTLEGANLVGGAGTPGNFSVFLGGTAGTTTYTYACTAVTANGETPAGTGTTTVGNATLSATNYTIPKCVGSAGAQSLNIYRTSTTGGLASGKIANVPAGNASLIDSLIFKDIGIAGDGTTPPVVNTSGKSTVFGPSTASSFIGDGSALTNVNTTKVNGATIPLSASYVATNGSGQFIATPNVPSRFVGTITSVAGTSDNLTVAGLTASNHCSLQLTNASAAALTANYLTVSSGTTTWHHSTSVGGESADVFCNAP